LKAACEVDGDCKEIDRIQREIQALGAVNLTALDRRSNARRLSNNFSMRSRLTLNETMATLEDAIRKSIETRGLLAQYIRRCQRPF
jgi:chromosome segregation protein